MPVFRSLSWAFIALLSVSATASAGTRVEVQLDQARMITLPTEPRTIVVGNPAIADVTTKGTNVFVFGRAGGVTNVIFLDSKGQTITALDVSVDVTESSNVLVYRAGKRFTYSCEKDCAPAVSVGDEDAYSKQSIGQMTRRSDLNTGAASK